MQTMGKNRTQAMEGIIQPFIADLIATDPFWTKRAATLTSVPNHSAVLAPQVAVGLIELGAGDRRTITSLAGVAPIPSRAAGTAATRPSAADAPRSAARYLMALTAIHRDP